MYPRRPNPERTWEFSATSCPVCGSVIRFSLDSRTERLTAIRCGLCNITVNIQHLFAVIEELRAAQATPHMRLRSLEMLMSFLTIFPKRKKRSC